MKVSHKPNFEVLGAPTGDPIFCAKFLAQRFAKAAKLLSQLVTVGSLDPQVALLLCQCAGYCKLVHLARSTPPSLISDGLALFDADVRHFSQCTRIDAANTEWLQVQLSLGRGGLGLHSLALHSLAASLASLIKAGSLIPSDEYALEYSPTSACNFRRSLSYSQKDLLARLETINLISCYFSRPLPTVHVCCLCSHAMLQPGCQSFLQWVLTFTLNLMSSRLH